MNKGTTIIAEQLQLASMAAYGLFEHLCEHAGLDGTTPELQQKIAHVRKAIDATRIAVEEMTQAGAINEPS